MEQTLLEMAKDLTRSLVETGKLSAEDMQRTLQQAYATLSTLKAQEEAGTTSIPMPASTSTAVDWRKSITRQAVTCLECGQSWKQLTIRHLMTHGLDTRSYRSKYGIPRTQPLTARDTTRRRQQLVQTVRPWEKAPAYLKAQTRDGHASPEPEAAAVYEEAEEMGAEAPVQPKQQRKTSPNQSARKKQVAG
jgi:predicted transcriptional regulator